MRILLVLILTVFVTSCLPINETPTNCIKYCEFLNEWSEKCSNIAIDLSMCKKHFLTYPGYYNELNLVCWTHLVRMFPNKVPEFDCNDLLTFPNMSRTLE